MEPNETMRKVEQLNLKLFADMFLLVCDARDAKSEEAYGVASLRVCRRLICHFEAVGDLLRKPTSSLSAPAGASPSHL